MELSAASDLLTLPDLRVLPVRDGVLLFELPGLAPTLGLLAALEADPLEGVTEMIPAARTILISFDEMVTAPAALVTQVRARLGQARASDDGALVEIPAVYTGEDLPVVADLLGVTVAEVIRRHTDADYRVAFTGFAPGFAYLSAGEAGVTVPRRSSPRTLVPAGSVAVAGGFSGVYPTASPGGWHLIGTTPLVMFDVRRQPATLLQPGNRVVFRDMSKGVPVPVAALPKADPVPEIPADTACVIEVTEAPLPVLMQDLGRPGLASQGISLSGAADRGSLRLVNRLAGNAAGEATLEIGPAGFGFSVTGRAVMALTGALRRIEIQPASGAGFAGMLNRPLALEPGDRVLLGPALAGARSYLSFRGGYAVAPVLGSCATDTLAKIGPDPVGRGRRLALRPAPAGAVVMPEGEVAFAMPAPGEIVTLDVIPGPRTDWFTEESVQRFFAQAWQVTPQSSRVGIRLSGQALERSIPGELPSEGTVRGALQVPASGQPVLFLADHPLTGGYPVIACVAAHHLDLAGQIPVGASIRFRPLSAFADVFSSANPVSPGARP
jgi:KipI family sensor histidine kinase inhibitor